LGKYQHYLQGSGLLGGEKQWLCEMLKHSSEKLNFIPKKKRNERQSRRKSKVFRLPFLISQQKRLFDQSSFTIQMSLGGFQSKISHGSESRKILLLTFISLIFRYVILYAKYVELLDKLKEVKKIPIFIDCDVRALLQTSCMGSIPT
jgi:hypothetical protein